ncbi:hypothetical protein [Stutzerimonas stutzeri]|uniref:hypothetical protein n=3 Tax=Stutzerimonas stutzeri group TaxID=136846 RepID=UPI00156A2B8C|nr:hypothetical protein [Stutzerimonas stutzeri]
MKQLKRPRRLSMGAFLGLQWVLQMEVAMRPSTVESLKESLAIWQELEAGDLAQRSLVTEMAGEIQRKILSLESLLGLYAVHGLGLTLKHCRTDSWGILSEDSSEPGRYRWTMFGKDGFTGHCTQDTAELCIGDMLDDGFMIPDMGALERLSCTTEWQRGMEVCAVIQACNAGRLSWQEANDRYAEIDQRYRSAA